MTLQRYETATEWPLTGLAVAFLAAYAWPILDPDLNGDVVAALGGLTVAVWVLFGLDYLTRLYLAPARWAFVRGHVLDLVILAVPVFRPLRALRVVPILLRLNQRATISFRGQVATYVAGAVGLVVFIAALAVLDAERDSPEANITSFSDALWWAATTVTTVGYGDRFPTTAEGRWVAVVLMLAGIALLGVVTAALASWFVERLNRVEEAEAETRDDIAALTAEVRRLRAAIDERQDSAQPNS
jgi:voltage-gated potassium channel